MKVHVLGQSCLGRGGGCGGLRRSQGRWEARSMWPTLSGWHTIAQTHKASIERMLEYTRQDGADAVIATTALK